MDGAVHRQRTDAGFRFWGIVAATRQNGVNRIAQGLVQRDSSIEAHAHFGNVCFERVHQIIAQLQVTWILTGFAVHQSGMGRGNRIGISIVCCLLEQVFHGLGILVETNHIPHDALDLRLGQWLKVRNKIAGPG